MRWAVGGAVVLGLIVYQLGPQRASGQAATNCYVFSDAGPGCPTCVPSSCGNCVADACEPEQMVKCYKKWDLTEVDPPAGWHPEEVTKPCGGVFACVYDAPCEGQACRKGGFLYAVPGQFDTNVKGAACKDDDYSDPLP